MYTKILVPLDGSELSERVLPYARSFAKALKLPVELLQVIDPAVIETLSDPERGRYVDIVEADMKGNVQDYLSQVAGSFEGASTVTCVVRIGNPAEIIADRGSADPGILIAMSTRGRSGVQRWVLGSVADKVLHSIVSDMLLIRGDGSSRSDGEAMLKTVVVPLDGSHIAEKVLPHAVGLAKNMKLEVILLRAYSLPASIYFSGEEYGPDLGQLTEQIREEAREYLEAKVQALRSEGLESVSSVLLQGEGAAEIIDTAQKTPDNLVAMCTHGRSGLSRWVLGSVTERVILHSGDPVLVVRAAAQA